MKLDLCQKWLAECDSMRTADAEPIIIEKGNKWWLIGGAAVLGLVLGSIVAD